MPVLNKGQESTSHFRRNLVVGVAVAMVAVAAYFGAASLGIGLGKGSGSTNVVNGVLTVTNVIYSDYPFSTPSGVSSASIQGTFQVIGGSANQVYVLVMNSTVFGQWKGDFYSPKDWGSLSFYYDSGSKNNGTMDVPLPAGGSFYLVLYDPQQNNNVVRASVNLIYG